MHYDALRAKNLSLLFSKIGKKWSVKADLAINGQVFGLSG